MRKGTRVSWVTAAGVAGSGEVFTDEEGGHVLVAVDAPAGEEHRVIRCAVTWLTPTVQAPSDVLAPAPDVAGQGEADPEQPH